jgi:hypothetical protein
MRLGTGVVQRNAIRLETSNIISNGRTVSQIWSLIWLLSMVMVLEPNSTPIVRSCTGWKRLSVNWRSKQDFPTAVD